jgi:benzoyl-CoA 2,3-dioxygenase component A
LLRQPNTLIYLCGLKGMEGGVDEAFTDICRQVGMDWATVKSAMRSEGRYHVETY